jgi:hypothetical protein
MGAGDRVEVLQVRLVKPEGTGKLEEGVEGRGLPLDKAQQKVAAGEGGMPGEEAAKTGQVAGYDVILLAGKGPQVFPPNSASLQGGQVRVIENPFVNGLNLGPDFINKAGGLGNHD